MKRKLSPTLQVVVLVLVSSFVGAILGRAAPMLPVLGSTATAAPLDVKQEGAAPLSPVSSAFTYQGRLLEAGSPANGSYDFRFSLHDAATGGNQVGSVVILNSETVTDGLFTVQLDFGSSAFVGEAHWLRIGVKPAGGPSFTFLTPRQPLTATPYAQHARNAETAPWNGISGRPVPYSPLRASNTLSTLDSAGIVGSYTSITIGSDGLGLISYHDETNGDLKVAHCENAACSSVITATLDSTGTVGTHTSIIVGPDGLGLISYYDATNLDLKVAHCADVTCSSATTATLDGAGDVGPRNSV
jgi:hypothetical protein